MQIIAIFWQNENVYTAGNRIAKRPNDAKK